MDKIDKLLLTDEIIDIKKQNLEELWVFTKESLSSYFIALLTYGPFHQITMSIYHIWKEFYNILVKEQNIIDFLREKHKKIKLSEAYLLLDELDEINEETYLYYIDILFGIRSASELKQTYRAVRPKKDFDTLIETDDYELKAYGLILSLDDVKNFLNYSEHFWTYIKSKIRIINQEQDKCMVPEVIMKFDDNNCLIDIRVIVPEIVDLKTTLINVHEFQHAYDLYLLLGQPIPYSDEYYEDLAKKKENEFQKKLTNVINGYHNIDY